MSGVIKVRLEELTSESFAPYGELISTGTRAPSYHGDSFTDSWEFGGFNTDGTTQFILVKARYRNLRFSTFERHLDITQAFIPLSGPAAAAAFAEPARSGGLPPADSVRAFLIDGTVGYILKKGIWHSPRFPLQPPHTEMVVVTALENTEEFKNTERAKWVLTEEADFEDERGQTFEFER